VETSYGRKLERNLADNAIDFHVQLLGLAASSFASVTGLIVESSLVTEILLCWIGGALAVFADGIGMPVGRDSRCRSPTFQPIPTLITKETVTRKAIESVFMRVFH
jgi:hypothetical protein